MAFSCIFEQVNIAVLDKLIKWHLRKHIWSLNLDHVFKPTSFNLVLVALAQITTYLHVMIMHHNVHCIDCISFSVCR